VRFNMQSAREVPNPGFYKAIEALHAA